MTKKRSVGSKQQYVAWLPTLVLALLWGLGVGIFAWLAAGIACQRNYTNLTCARQEWLRFSWPSLSLAQDVWIPLLFLVFSSMFACIFGIRKNSVKEGAQKSQSTLHKILFIVAPILFLILAVAVLTVTLATYNDPWKGNHLGLINGFGALFASVGALATVSVTYKIGEENRETQKEIEGRKQDAELIKTLNDRLHEIIPRRYGNNPAEVSASYFQLAALYQDWETLAASSPLVEGQKESQQRNILKILFGVYQEDKKEPNNSVPDTEAAESISELIQQKKSGVKSRSRADIRTLDSVIQDIFPAVPEEENGEPNENPGGEGDSRVFDLSYLDLRELDFSKRNLNSANLKGSLLAGANLTSTCLRSATLVGANLTGDVKFTNTFLVGADLKSANLEDAYLSDSYLEDVDFRGARLNNSILVDADLRGAKFTGANLSGAIFCGADLYNAEFSYANFMKPAKFFAEYHNVSRPADRLEVINQLKVAKSLHKRIAVMGKDFNDVFDGELRKAHEEYWAEKEKHQVSEDQS